MPRVVGPTAAMLTDMEEGQVVRGDEFSMRHGDPEVLLSQPGRYVQFDREEFT